MEPDIDDYQTYAPLLAYMNGKSESEQDAILAHFIHLPETEKEILVGTATVQKILDLIASGAVPQSHGKVVAQLIYLVLDGQVAPDAIVATLTRLNLPDATAQQATQAIQDIALRASTARSAVASDVPDALAQVPPLTVTAPTPPPTPTWPGGTQPTAHTILDLRTPKPPTS